MAKHLTPKIIGSRIRAARQKANISQAELARMLKYKKRTACAYISRVENGKAGETRLSTIGRIAKALGTTSEALLAN